MRTYRLNRERTQLEDHLTASRKNLNKSGNPIIRLMCQAEVASYEHALTIVSDRQDIASDLKTVINETTILPHVALLLWGLAVFHNDDAAIHMMRALPSNKLTTETRAKGRDAKHRTRILKIMAILYAATQAASESDLTAVNNHLTTASPT